MFTEPWHIWASAVPLVHGIHFSSNHILSDKHIFCLALPSPQALEYLENRKCDLYFFWILKPQPWEHSRYFSLNWTKTEWDIRIKDHLLKFEIGNLGVTNKRKGKKKTKCSLKLSGSKFTEVITHRGDINSKSIGSKLFCYLSSLKYLRNTYTSFISISTLY